MSKTAAVFGGGIAGLSAAHELSRRGWAVTVYEANAEVGGFFRSTRAAGDRNMPSEYSWHGMGPWYHNVFDLMKQIPFDATGSVYEKALSRPIDFGMVPDDDAGTFDDSRFLNVRSLFRMTRLDLVRWAWLTLKTWTAHRLLIPASDCTGVHADVHHRSCWGAAAGVGAFPGSCTSDLRV